MAPTISWNNAPSIDAGYGVTTAVPATSAGDLIELDVTTLVNSVLATNGAGNYGFRIDAAGAGGRVKGFNSGEQSWELTVAVNSQPDAPDSLSPNGRTGSGSPVLSWVLGETRIEATQQTAFEVQIDPGEDEVTPDWVSGTVVSSVPQLDLSGTTYPGLAGGATTFWRVRVLDGEWSDWSDWAEWTRTAKPGVTVTSPTGGTIYDPSPVVEFSVNTGTMEFFRVIVTPTGQPTTTLYNSGLQDADGASTVVFTIPARDQQNRLVFADDQSYDIEMRAIDLADRVGTPGDPRYVSAVATVTYDDDVNGPITGLVLVAGGDHAGCEGQVDSRLSCRWVGDSAGRQGDRSAGSRRPGGWRRD